MRLVYNVYDDENQIESKQFDNFPEALEYAKQGLITYICEEDLDCPDCEERVVWTWDSTWDDEEAISNVKCEKQNIEPCVEDGNDNIEITISGPAEEVESLIDLIFDSAFDLDWDSPVEETKVEDKDFADEFGYEDEPAAKDLDFDVENPFEDDLYNLEKDLGEDEFEIGDPEIMVDPAEESKEDQPKKLVEEDKDSLNKDVCLNLDPAIARRFTKTQLNNLTPEEIKILQNPRDRAAIDKLIAKYNPRYATKYAKYIKESLTEDIKEDEIEEIEDEEFVDSEVAMSDEEVEEILTTVEEIKEIAAEAGEAIASVYEDKPMLEQEDIKEITDEIVENKLEEQSEDELSDEEPEELDECVSKETKLNEGDSKYLPDSSEDKTIGYVIALPEHPAWGKYYIKNWLQEADRLYHKDGEYDLPWMGSDMYAMITTHDLEEAHIYDSEEDAINDIMKLEDLQDDYDYGETIVARSYRTWSGQSIVLVDFSFLHTDPDDIRYNKVLHAIKPVRMIKSSVLELDEQLEESTHAQYAKPEGDKVAAYNNALKYAKKNNADYIYGYTNHSGKFFALEQPIKMSEKIGETEKEFRNKYKNCLTVYVAYRDKDFVESVELEGTDNAVVDCKVADVVTHSEDEKPVDCKGEKKPLEKPLTEEVDLAKAAAQCSRKCYDFYKAIADKAPDKELKKQGKVASKFVKDQYGLTGKAAEDLLLKGYAVWKSLNESLEHKCLTSEQLAEIDAYLRSGKDLQLEDFEEEHADFAIDIVSGELTYNSKTNDFTFYLSVYHASEDNNAENVEYHTDEEEYSFDNIEEVYDEFPGYLEDIYKWNASKISKVEEAIQMTRDELMDKEGTTDVDLINAGRPEEERVELVESDDFYQPDRELVGYVIVDIEYGAKYEPVYFKKGWEKFSQKYGQDTEYHSYDDEWYDQIITEDLDEVELYDSVEEALEALEDFYVGYTSYCAKIAGKNTLLVNWACEDNWDIDSRDVDVYKVKPLYHCTQSWDELDEQLKENCKIDESKLEDTEIDLAESVSQEISNAYKQLSKAYGRDIEELVYGPNGFMATKYPNGFPDFSGDIIYSDKYWAKFEEWLEAQDQIKEDLEDDLTDQEFAEQLQARLTEIKN